MSASFCIKCGTELPAGALFCPSCGTAAPDAAGPPPQEPPSDSPPEPPPPPAAKPPAAPPPAAPPPASAPKAGPQKTSLVYGGIALAVVLALIGGVLVATRGSKGEPGTAPGEVFLEPVDFTATDPFTEDLDTNTAPPPVQLTSSPSPAGSPSPTVPASPTVPVSPTPGAVGIRSVQGNAPGLYGGTQDESACDAARLVQFLQAEPAKARAWAAVQGIRPAAIPEFVAGLTPLVLRADTRVTNHGYSDGRATPLQSVLQAGTAVLVDDFGIPRVKCGCGNPLLPPEPQAQGVTYTGTRWPRFRPANVLIVVNTVQIRVTKFVVVNLVRPGFFTRPVGVPAPGALPEDGTILIDEFCDLFPDDCRPPSLVPGGQETTRPGEPELGTGDVQVTLRWSSTADLDLAVTDPTGETVSFGNPASSSGGQLDVDSNAGCNSPTATPVENVFWPTGQSPDGEYTITVTYYGECPGGEGPQTYDLTVLMGGTAVQTMAAPLVLPQTGTLNAPGEQATVTATKGEGATGVLPPGAPESLTVSSIGVDPGSLYISWGPSFLLPPEVGIEDAYEMTVQPGGETFVFPNGMFDLTLPGLEPGVEYTFTMVAVNAAGKSSPVTATGTPWPPDEEAPPEEPPAPPPEPETLEEYCDRMFPPPPTTPAENPQWTLCMHDPTSPDAIQPGSLPVPVGPTQ